MATVNESEVPRSAKVPSPKGLPLFGKNDYPLRSVGDCLLQLPQSREPNFKLLIWTEDKKGFAQYPVGRKVFEEEFGYSSKEEAFYNECEKRGNRWRKEIASDYSILNTYLQKDRFHTLVIVGESLSNLALKSVHYLEKIEAGPKRVIIGFHNRALHPAEFYGVWRYLESCGRLHLLRNFAYLLTSKSNRKYLPVIYERKIVDLTIPIWECDFEGITDKHILRLFTEQIEKGQHLDYKREDSLTDKKVRRGLLKDFCAMANSGGGILLIGIKDRDCRPLTPPKAGLQNITKSGKHIESLTQVLNTEFGRLGPQVKMRSIEVMKKNIVVAKIYPSVIGLVRPRDGDPDQAKYPFRQGSTTGWHKGA